MSQIQGIAQTNEITNTLPTRTPIARSGVRDPWVALVPIVVLAVISGITYYLGFTHAYPLAEHYKTPLLELGKISRGVPNTVNWFALAWVVIFAIYYLAFCLCPPALRVSPSFRRTTLAIICVAGVAFSIILLFMYPITAADLFDQIFRGRLTTHYGDNPFIVFPATYSGDPFFPYVAWNSEGSPYGPVWEWFATVPSWLGGDSLWNNIIYFKMLVILAYGACTALTYVTLRALKPEWALRGTLFFAWNPLLLFEVAGNGHNDIVMAVFLLAAVYFFVQGYRLGFLPALMAGVLTKFIPLLLIPVGVAALWRDRLPLGKVDLFSRFRKPSKSVSGSENTRLGGGSPTTSNENPQAALSNFAAFRNIAIGGALSLLLAVIMYAPFWQGTQTIGALGRQNLFTSSFPTLSYLLLERNYGISTEAAKGIARNTSLVLIALIVIGFTLYVFLNKNARTPPERRALIFRTLRAFYEILFFYLALTNLWFQPWYLIWLVALAPLMADYVTANRTLLFCIGGILNYFVWFFIWGWNRADGMDITVTAILAVYFLPLFYTLYAALKAFYDRIWSRQAQAAQAAVPADVPHEVIVQEVGPSNLSTRPARSRP